MIKKLTLFLLLSITAILPKEAIAPGITYDHVTCSLPPISVHIVEIDLSRNQLELVSGKSDGLGMKKVSKMSQEKNATVAINAGFHEKDGTPSFARKIKKSAQNFLFDGYNVFWDDGDEKIRIGRIEDETWFYADYLVSGLPRLIHRGEVCEWDLSFRFEKVPHPRTAIGILKNGNIVLVIVDGHILKSIGMTLNQLAAFMLNIGCIEALNLDGGGSSTLCIDSKIKNKPSGDIWKLKCPQELPVSDSIIVFPRDNQDS